MLDLEYGENDDQLYAIPLLITNYEAGGNKVNQRKSGMLDYFILHVIFIVAHINSEVGKKSTPYKMSFLFYISIGSDPKDWQFVRRLYLVDNVSGKPASTSGIM